MELSFKTQLVPVATNLNMLQHDIFEVPDRSLLPQYAKVLSTTWALKKKANGVYKGCITARGFEPRDGEHYFYSSETSVTY
jgi:hypothetical protein